MVPDETATLLSVPSGYAEWLIDLKGRIHTAQQKAALAVNREMVGLYWHIGHEILVRQAGQGWGAKVIERLARDLRAAFPEIRGFSPRNLKYMRAFAEAWPEPAIVQQAAAQLPWFHICTLLDKLKSREERDWYLGQAVEYNWSRKMLAVHIDSGLRHRTGAAQSNFAAHLPKAMSDLARESLKDPYKLEFLGLGREAEERDLEAALVQHITQFLLELGAGFAYVGRQVHLEIGGDDFFIDLLFYHLKLRCYVVVEIKAGKFKPEHLGQLVFYLTAVDAQIKAAEDGATIGLLLCKTKNKVVAEYALRDNGRPMGIAEFQLTGALNAVLQTSLPSIASIEQELAGAPGS